MTVGTRVLRLGTRGSALALAQAAQVAAALGAAGTEVRLIEVRTAGDVSAAAISRLGGTGVFVGALRERLLAGEVDLAVHSLKDLPTAAAPGLRLAAVPVREDPREVLVDRAGRRLAELPPGTRIGTGAPRRAAQLRALRRGLDVVGVRGNVDTRLRALAGGGLDALVLARAGLARLGRLDAVTEVLDPAVVLPAPGQGALAIECRIDDPATAALAGALDDPGTRATVGAERELLARLQAGCTAPVGALATLSARTLRLAAVVAAPDGERVLAMAERGPLNDPTSTARRLADRLLAAGAADVIGESR